MVRVRTIRRAQRILTSGETPVGLLDQQVQITQRVAQLEASLNEATSRLGAVGDVAGAVSRSAVRGHGVVRFNAFGDLGGNQSWSLALIDARGDGVVITGLYGREETRLYVKHLVDGVSDRELSDEEGAAVAAARKEIA